MADSNVSPTGKPLLPTSWLPVLVPVVSALPALNTYFQQAVPHDTVFKTVLNYAVPAIVALFGLLSPGVRTQKPE